MSASTGSATTVELPLHGAAAPPRSNGELTFSAPWQARLFGLTLDLVEQQALTWSTFQAQLIDCISERGAASGREYEQRSQDQAELPDERLDETRELDYYGCWLAALERLLISSVLDEPAIETLSRELAGRPHGHDH